MEIGAHGPKPVWGAVEIDGVRRGQPREKVCDPGEVVAGETRSRSEIGGQRLSPIEGEEIAAGCRGQGPIAIGITAGDGRDGKARGL